MISNAEIDFTGKFLVNLDRLSTFFRSGEITVEINLKLGRLLEDLVRKETPLRNLKDLAASHYNNDKNINEGFNIMLKQLSDLRRQLEISNEGASKKILFNSGEFENGYRLVKERLRQILEGR
jgi:hypothetical protein